MPSRVWEEEGERIYLLFISSYPRFLVFRSSGDLVSPESWIANLGILKSAPKQ